MQLDVYPSTERGWERIMAPTYSLRLPKKCHWCQYETVWFSHNLDRNFVVLETFWVYPLPPPRRFFMKDSWKETCKFNASSMRNDWTFYCQFKSELFHVFLMLMVFFLVSHKIQKTRTIQKVICDDTFNHPFPGNIYLFKVSKRNAKKRWEMCCKLTIKTPENFNDDFLVSLRLTLNIFHTFF